MGPWARVKIAQNHLTSLYFKSMACLLCGSMACIVCGRMACIVCGCMACIVCASMACIVCGYPAGGLASLAIVGRMYRRSDVYGTSMAGPCFRCLTPLRKNTSRPLGTMGPWAHGHHGPMGLWAWGCMGPWAGALGLRLKIEKMIYNITQN